MNRTIIAIGALCLLAVGGAVAQVPAAHERSTVPPASRYEIVQSSRIARDTFRLDRFSGRVSILSLDTATGLSEWVAIPFPLDLKPSNEASFEIFVSGLNARDTFLLDARTGATWELVEAAETKLL